MAYSISGKLLYSIYGILLFLPMLMGEARNFRPYLTTPTTTTTTTTPRPTIRYEPAIEETQFYLAAIPPVVRSPSKVHSQVQVRPVPTILGARVTNCEGMGDVESKRDADISINTQANAIIRLLCDQLELYQGDSIEIVTDDRRWIYNSTFDISANSIMMRFRTPSRKGIYDCQTTLEEREGGFKTNPNCICGLKEYNPIGWSKSLLNNSVGPGHRRPFARQKRMVSGHNANEGTLHYLTSALLKGTTPFCGATVVSQNVAVTSAFCVKGRKVSDPYYILVGTKSFAIKKVTSVKGLEPWRVVKMISHPEYNGSYANNIAVVKFKSAINSNIGYPACLPINMFGSLHGRWFTALGWGASSKSSKVAVDSLRQIGSLELKPVQDCQAIYKFPGSAEENEHSLCMVANTELDTTRDMTVCGIDSGGPIFYPYQNSRHVYLIGIIGESGNCDPSQPTMHTNVEYYLDWLSTVLNKEGQTVCVK